MKCKKMKAWYSDAVVGKISGEFKRFVDPREDYTGSKDWQREFTSLRVARVEVREVARKRRAKR